MTYMDQNAVSGAIQELNLFEIAQVGGGELTLEEIASWNVAFGKAFKEYWPNPVKLVKLGLHYVDILWFWHTH